ncbi:hypothetical protein QE152_g11323 [Popillia japonica]|uniref:Uncharacterized protein n=1 Tax=Popillia japonica TaxID=7064 RepID=A0AAW1LRZ3_POPJA
MISETNAITTSATENDKTETVAVCDSGSKRKKQQHSPMQDSGTSSSTGRKEFCDFFAIELKSCIRIPDTPILLGVVSILRIGYAYPSRCRLHSTYWLVSYKHNQFRGVAISAGCKATPALGGQHNSNPLSLLIRTALFLNHFAKHHLLSSDVNEAETPR